MSEVSRAFRRLAELTEQHGKSIDVAVRMVADEIEREECKTVPVETPVDRKPDEDAFRARMTGAAIRLVESAEMADETLRFWLQQLHAVIEKGEQDAKTNGQ